MSGISTARVIQMLRKQQGMQSLRSFARQLGISAPYLSDIYNRKRNPGPKILRGLGLEVTIRRKHGKLSRTQAA